MTFPSIIHREPQACIILDLRCANCGPVRMAIAATEPTPGQMPCPYCDTESAATPIGSGSTRRVLPFYDLAPRDAELATVQVLSAAARPLSQGQIVCFSEEPDVYHFAKIETVYTNRVHVSVTGRPSVSFIITGMETDPIPHISGAETRPWWCFPDELPKAPEKPASVVETVVATVAKVLPKKKTSKKSSKKGQLEED
jgi:hypothetical protein